MTQKILLSEIDKSKEIEEINEKKESPVLITKKEEEDNKEEFYKTRQKPISQH
jgi:hypothetical protein